MNKKIVTASCFVVAGLTLSSCELLRPPQTAKLPLEPLAKEEPDGQAGVMFEQLQNKPLATESMQSHIELYPGTERSISPLATSERRSTPRGTGSYSLNFDDADLGEVAKVILSDILGQNYVLSPKVAGKVTLQTTQALTKEELLPTLEMLLQMNNAALVKDGRIYHIEPATEALYSADFSVAGAGRAGYQLKVIPVKNVAADEVAAILKPLVHDKTILHVDTARNILFASGTADEMARVMDLVNTFDVDVLKGRSFGLFPLAHVDPKEIIDELEAVFNTKTGGEGGDFFRFIEIERLNAILAITHQSRYLKDIENWVLRLDRANTVGGGGVNVYKVQHVDAVELAATLNEIFTGAAKKRDKSAKVAPGQKAVEVSNKKTIDKQAAERASGGSKSSDSANIADIGSEVRIIADEINNSVIVVATAQEYEVIHRVINQLDVMPLQVLIDATIVDVTLKDELTYGIQWFLEQGNTAIGSGLGRANFSDLAVSAAAASATGGLSLLQDSGAVKALLSAQATDGNVNVISSPSLMVLNNQEASIQVGNEISLRTSQSIPLTSTAVDNSNFLQTNSLQQRKTGVKLKVKPRVNASGLVILEIEQSVEDPGARDETGSNPDILTREITSSVAVQSGETIVLGGLIKENKNDTKAGIPFLHELPLIGPLFGNTRYIKDKTELVVLITPRVVTSKQDAREISDEFKRKLTGIYQEVPVVFDSAGVE
jgi:general secretion pathway protein D